MLRTRRNRLAALGAALAIAIFVVPALGLPYGGVDFLQTAAAYVSSGSITAISPSSGPDTGGTSITLTCSGADCSTATQVNFGFSSSSSSAAYNTTVSVSSATASSVVATTPNVSASDAGQSTTPFIAVKNSGGTTLASCSQGGASSGVCPFSFTIPAPATTSGGGGGGGGGGGTTTSSSTTVSPAGPISASQLTGTAPAPVSVTVNATAGANVVAGNVGVTLPAGFVSVPNANVSITPTLPAGVNIASLAGNVVGSPNGTAFDISVNDPATGAQVVAFNTPVTFTVAPNAADIAIANGNANILTIIYFTAPNTSPVFNPLGLPANTPVFQPDVKHNPDGTISWSNQNGAGVVQAVVANPVSYVQTVNPTAAEFSSFDPGTSQTFATKPQFSYLQVVEPQIPQVNRLVVLDPDTGNYSYVNATDVGPSGPPPPKSASAVVRGARR